jgi:hypothetical protein
MFLVDVLALGHQHVLVPLVEQAEFLGMAKDIPLPPPMISSGYNSLDARETYILALLDAVAAKGASCLCSSCSCASMAFRSRAFFL